MNPSNNGRIVETIPIPNGEHTRTFRAEDIRKTSTGTHARVAIFTDKRLLSYDIFNIGRRRDRESLANAAHKAIDNSLIADAYPASRMKHDFDLFCATVWPNYLANLMPQPVAGDAVNHPTVFLAEPYIIQGGGTILFAPPGRGKSFCGLLFAVSVDAGCTQLWPVTQGRALFINLERSGASIQRRLGSINTALGEDPARELLILNARGKTLDEVSDLVARTVEEYGVEFIVLDSISRAGSGDLNENKSVNSIIDTLNNLCPTWLGLAHTPRADESHVFGGVHFDAGADILVQGLTQRTDDALGIGLKMTKANDVGFAPLMVFRLTFDQFGLQSVERSDAQEFTDMLLTRNLSNADKVAEYLTDDVSRATVKEIAERLGKDRGNVAKLLTADKRFIIVGEEGKSKVWGVQSTSYREGD